MVEADAFADGHDVLTCGLRFRHDGDHQWSSVSMAPLGNDRWRAEFAVRTMGHYRFVVHARVDHFLTWRRDLRVRLDAGQDLAVELLVGAELIDDWPPGAPTSTDQHTLSVVSEQLRSGAIGLESAVSDETVGWSGVSSLGDLIFSEEFGDLMSRWSDPDQSVTSQIYTVAADRERARFSTWYEMFPRSASPDHAPPRHVRRRPGPAALRGAHGVRRALSPADPSHRSDGPQGPRRRDAGAEAGTRAARGPSVPPRAATGRSIPSSARSTTSGTW